MIDHAAEAKPWVDVNPQGPLAHDLPHKFLPDTDDHCYTQGDGECISAYECMHSDVCQFVAGGLRCQGKQWEHWIKWPNLNPRKPR